MGAGVGGGCIDIEVTLEPELIPLDLIVSVVNSSTGSASLTTVEQHLAGGLVQPIIDAGVDLQTILITDHGSAPTSICMAPPLGNGDCNGSAVSKATFRHYSTMVPPGGVLCRVLTTLHGETPDEFGLAPGGWVAWLRQPAFKAFLVFDAGGVGCAEGMTSLDDQDDDPTGQQVALAFDAELLANTGQFGTPTQRRYGVYFAGGFAPQDVSNTGFLAGLPTQFQPCGGQSGAPGTGYQWLAVGTDSLRFSSCNNSNLPPVLSQTAFDLVTRKVADRCHLTFTPPDVGMLFPRVQLDPDDPNTPLPEEFTQVLDEHMCGQQPAFYFVGTNQIQLCPAACDVVLTTPGRLSLLDACP
ncbi:MAG: hypothetical protein AAFN41_02545 [Planctomycetota bacterium]